MMIQSLLNTMGQNIFFFENIEVYFFLNMYVIFIFTNKLKYELIKILCIKVIYNAIDPIKICFCDAC